MTERTDEPRLGAEDRQLVEALRSELDPGPRTPAQSSVFAQRLEERLAGRSSPWRPLALATASALAALTLWLAVPATWLGAGDAAEASGLLAYAYYETDLLDDAPEGGLPAEYEAIAQALDLL